jgi:Na+-transporting NADH:ubiquinone oxidoreductase subunit A
MAEITITRGFDIPMTGQARKELDILPDTPLVAVLPDAFHNIKPKLLVQEGDTVLAGTPLFFDKQEERFHFCSPASGTIKTIHYGERRKIEHIIIETDGKKKHVSFPARSLKDLEKANPEDLQEDLLKAGLWPLLRERPFNRIARPDKKPKSIFISLIDTAPLAADPLFLIQGKEDLFIQGITCLKKFTDGPVHICGNGTTDLEKSLKGVEKHVFTGPHPAGNPGVHIHHIDPVNRGESVWVVRPQDLVLIMSFLTTGVYPQRIRAAVAGEAASNPRYVEIPWGAPLTQAMGKISKDADVRLIAGNVLTGEKKEKDGYFGFYDTLLTLIPENRERRFLGWIAPGLKAFSYSKTFLSALFPQKSYSFDTNRHGGHRAFVQTGLFEKVVPMDIYPDYLIRSILAEDIPEMEALGLYEVVEEDLALCAYVDPSKNDINAIVRQGLDLLEREG